MDHGVRRAHVKQIVTIDPISVLEDATRYNDSFDMREWDALDTHRLQAIVRFLESEDDRQLEREGY
jgi:hypothetical protein